MSLRLTFGHSSDGNATTVMSIDGAEDFAFNYVTLVKWLFDNQGEAIEVDIADSYTDDQKTRIKELLLKIGEAAKGGDAEPAPLNEKLEDISF